VLAHLIIPPVTFPPFPLYESQSLAEIKLSFHQASVVHTEMELYFRSMGKLINIEMQFPSKAKAIKAIRWHTETEDGK